MTFKQLYPRDKATFKRRERLQPGRHQHTQNIVVLLSLDGTILTDTTSFSGVGGTSYYGLYGKAPSKGCTLFRLQVYERVGISSGGSRRGAWRPPPSLIFGPKWSPKGRKKVFGRPPPPPLLSQGLDPALISLVEVYKKVRKTVISVWKRPKRAIRCILLLTMKKSRKRFVVWFIYVWKTVPLQGMWKGYHLSIEGIRKRHLVSVKNSICKGTVLDLGADPPRIKLFGVPPVDFPFHWLQWEAVIGWEFQSRKKEKIDLRSLFVTSRKSTFSGLNYIVIWVTWAVMELTLSTQGIHLTLDFLTVTY